MNYVANDQVMIIFSFHLYQLVLWQSVLRVFIASMYTYILIFVLRMLFMVNYVGDVISIRVPPEIKREMDRLRGEVNWSEEIRKFIKSKIEEYKRRRVLKEVVAYIQTLPTAPRGTAERLLREDRDSH